HLLGPSLAPRSDRLLNPVSSLAKCRTAKIVTVRRTQRRHIFRSRARWQSDLAWHALPRADRGVGLQHHSVLGFGRIEQRAAPCPYGYSFHPPLHHFCRGASLRCKRGLEVLDHGLKLLVCQVFERIAVLDLVLARDKQGETSQVHPRLLAAHLCDGFFSVLTEIA